MDQKKILIFGIGNPGRGDDGLGPELVERLRRDPRTRTEAPDSASVCEYEFRYQLNVEDALAIRDHHLIVFADASRDEPSRRKWTPGQSPGPRPPSTTGDAAAELTEVFPSDAIAFTTHRMSPASVLALCHELYGSAPKAYVLSIRGYHWDLGAGLSPQAEENLNLALDLIQKFLDTI